MDKKKILYCLSVIGGCFCFGIGAYQVGWAHAIPGIDKPYDPANYYSMTSISYADSAPSPFALKDLARQGGNVYDYARHLKSILSAQNAENWLTQALGMLGIDIQNTEPWEKTRMNAIQSNLTALQSDADNSNHSQEAVQVWEDNSFSLLDANGQTTADYDQRQSNYSKFASLLKGYASSAQSAIAAMADEQQTLAAINEMNDNAIGEQQSLQAKVAMENLLATQDQRTNQLLANITAMKSVEHKLDQAEEAAADRAIQDAQLIIEDPYNRSERSQNLYTKSAPKGFIKF